MYDGNCVYAKTHKVIHKKLQRIASTERSFAAIYFSIYLEISRHNFTRYFTTKPRLVNFYLASIAGLTPISQKIVKRSCRDTCLSGNFRNR